MSVSPEPDYAEERALLRNYILHRLQNHFRQAIAEDDLNQCVQDALVRLYRFHCRERELGREIRNLDAVRNRVASFAAADHLREKMRDRRFVPVATQDTGSSDDPEHEDGVVLTAPPPAVDFTGRLRFVLLEFFRVHNAPCVEIADHYLAERGWQEVAHEMRIQVDTVKQRWSRCVKSFRDYVAEHPEIEGWVFEEAP